MEEAGRGGAQPGWLPAWRWVVVGRRAVREGRGEKPPPSRRN
jgi:hypothetical protein